MSRPIVFWGATGQAIVLEEFLARAGFVLIAIFDNAPGRTSPFADVPIYHAQAGFLSWRRARPAGETVFCAVAIGGARGEERVDIQHFLAAEGLRPQTLVHPDATVTSSASLGPGCQVLARSVVGARAELGEACIVNSGSIVEHECRLGAGVHVAPGAVIAGCAVVDDHVFVGAGAVILPRLRIGAGSTIGAGAVVIRDVVAGTVVAGVPASPTRPASTRARGADDGR
jgi:sugar O-acyltransferase (sialic acid O-acetyltransferase NeuD family)